MSIVIKPIAGPLITRVTYPDLNYHQGATTMTPEQREACAARAYEIFAASSGEQSPWAAVKNKTLWQDAVRDHHLQPAAISRKTEPNLQERSVAQAYRELYQPYAQPALVVPPLADDKATKGKK
jgi:hypothetical protein